MTTPPLRFAILDLYAGTPNQGLACIREVLETTGRTLAGGATIDTFDVRGAAELPGLAHDVYVASGGPGSPYEGEGSAWEAGFFRWLDAVWRHNGSGVWPPKYVLAICHSFELVCRFFALATVTRRRSASFGIMPIHPTAAGASDPLLAGLPDPFFAGDFREWQVVQPDGRALAGLGASILALEKIRPHVPLERAVTSIRLSAEVVGCQFHPEARPSALAELFRRPAKREEIVSARGQAKYEEILARVADPACLERTYRTVMPGFLRAAVARLRPEAAADRAAS